MLQFAQPLWMLLTPLPLLLWWLAGGKMARRGAPQIPGILHPQAELLATLAGAGTVRRRPWLWLAGCLLLLVALSRPQWLDFSRPNNHQGYNIMLAIDVSGSMRAKDFLIKGKAVSRLNLLKTRVRQFIATRHNDRMGIILFADEALSFLPMSSDLSLLQSFIDDIRPGIAGERTALGDAIALAVAQLRTLPQKARLLLLFSDGGNTAGHISPAAATRLARQKGVKIFTIGVGTNHEVLFPRGPVQSATLTRLPLNETLLQRIATNSGGVYYHADSPMAMDRILRDIHRLAPTRIRDPRFAARQEWYWLPLICGIALLLLGDCHRRQVIPQ